MPMTPGAPPTAASSSSCGPRDGMLFLLWELRNLVGLVLVLGVLVGVTAHRLGR